MVLLYIYKRGHRRRHRHRRRRERGEIDIERERERKELAWRMECIRLLPSQFMMGTYPCDSDDCVIWAKKASFSSLSL